MVGMGAVTRTALLPVDMVSALQLASGGRGVSTLVLSMALEEAQSERHLLPIPQAVKKQLVTVSLKSAARDALKAVVGTRGTGGGDSEGSVLSRLAYTRWAMTNDKVNPAPEEAGITLPRLDVDRSFYPHQERFIRKTIAAIRGQSVAALESSTGSGKSLILAASAYIAAREGRIVVVASPTHRVSGQTHREFQRVNDGDGGVVRSVTIRGRREFVSEDKLLSFLETLANDGPLSPECERSARRWMSEQALAAEPWRIDALEESCPDVPVGDLFLSGDEADDDAGALAYRRQFESAAEAGVIFATHSMLAQDMRQRMLSTREKRVTRRASENAISYWTRDAQARFAYEHVDCGVLPNYDALLIDEAHDLERQFANAETGGVSLYVLTRTVVSLNNELGGISNAALIIENCYRTLRSLGERNEQLDLAPSRQSNNLDATTALNALKSLHTATSFALGKVGKKRLRKPGLARLLESLRRDHAVLDDMARRQEAAGISVSMSVTFSPKRDYPSLLMGPVSVRRQLTALWERLCLRGGGALLSATLYTPTFSGEASLDHIVSNKLALRRDLQALEHKPGEHRYLPRWVFSPVVLHRLPPRFGNVDHHPWMRVGSENDLAMAQWASSIGEFIRVHVAARAQGGTLILCTSYAAVNALGSALESLDGRLILSSRKTSFESLVRRYNELAGSAGRPVWISTGRAWTGLNLRAPDSVPASMDDYLTDLVIPTLPFWLNRSTTHAHKVDAGSDGFVLEAREMTLMLRQGLGRAVRREGIGQRNVWLLDPRASDTSKPYYRWVAGALKEYELNRAEDIQPV